MEPVETIEYRGHEIKIYQDADAQNPRTEFDNVGTMLCWHRRYPLGDKQPSASPEEFIEGLAMSASSEYEEAKERLQSIEDRLAGWHWSDGDKEMVPGHHIALWVKAKAFLQKLKEQALNQYVTLPLFLMDHSGISMSTGSFNDPWDSGQVGFIYCDLEKAKKEWAPDSEGGWDTPVDEWMDGTKYIGAEQKLLPPEQRKKITLRTVAERVLRGEVETYNQYLRGDVYGYTAGDDSCRGFFGSDHKESGLLEQARAAIDWKIRQTKRYVCSDCGSDNVSLDASAKWSVEEQKWELNATYDQAYCHECDHDTKLVEKFGEETDGKTD